MKEVADCEECRKKNERLRREKHVFNLCLKKYSTDFFVLSEKRLHKILPDNLVNDMLSESNAIRPINSIPGANRALFYSVVVFPLFVIGV